MQARPPVVTILGHVDHGKTTLLDYIRKSQIASREQGGITQKIGAYEVTTKAKDYATNKITFIDTPGHEAFSQLRARGATVADIAILIVDGKDSLMPQTIESISHIKQAKIPFIVAINKMDLADAEPDRVKQELLKYEVQVEGMGGNVPVALISAKTGKGVDDLLETILFLATDMKLSYEKNHAPEAYIIETKKDKRGVVVSAVIKNGVLKVGDVVYAGGQKTKIRSLINDRGASVTEAIPSLPFEILGFSERPPVGALVTNTEKEQVQPNQQVAVVEPEQKAFSLDSIMEVPSTEKKLSLVMKSDSEGSLEAINASLSKNTHVDIILHAVGDIHKSDVFLAKSTKAIIIGFNAKPDPEAKELAKQEKVIIKTYSIIYELLDELNEVADLLQEKEEQEKSLKGEAKVLAPFVIEGEKIYGVKVVKGKINIGDSIQLYRNNNLIGKSKLVSLQIRAKKVQEVKKDQEAGMVFSPPLDIRVGDMVKCIL